MLASRPGTPTPRRPAATASPSPGGADGAGKPAGADAAGAWSMRRRAGAVGTLRRPGSRERRNAARGFARRRRREDATTPARLEPARDAADDLRASRRSCSNSFGPLFQAQGLVPLQAGGVRQADRRRRRCPSSSPARSLAVPLLIGDVDMTAIGTTTEVLGDRVFGFGHPFNNEGPVTLPMGAGEINGVIANLIDQLQARHDRRARRHDHGRPARRRRRAARRARRRLVPIDLRVTLRRRQRATSTTTSRAPCTRASRRCSAAWRSCRRLSGDERPAAVQHGRLRPRPRVRQRQDGHARRHRRQRRRPRPVPLHRHAAADGGATTRSSACW